MDQGDTDKANQFHQNEASSAVADDKDKGEEEDDEYEELYGDINISEGFLQSVKNVNDGKVGFDSNDDHNHDVNAGISQNSGFEKGNTAVNEQATEGGSGEIRIGLGQDSSQQVVDRSNVGGVDPVTGGGGRTLFVLDLYWWTTDAEVEEELSKYGRVKDLYFFSERASGKSKGYCRVEFSDAAAAANCKEKMNGHEFNGRPCHVNRMGEPQANQLSVQAPPAQARDQGNGGWGNSGGLGVGTIPSSGNFRGGNGSVRYGRGNAQAMGNRGHIDPMDARGIDGYGRGMGFATPILHPNSTIMQPGGPSFRGPMGGFGGNPGGPTPPFLTGPYAFPPVGPQGVYPHLNPALMGQGMPMSTGVGMMPRGGFDGSNMRMWSSDPSTGGWNREGQGGGRGGQSGYAEEAASDHQHREGYRDQVSERDRHSSSHRRHRVNVDASREDMSSQDHHRGGSHRRERGVNRERERENKRHEERSQVRDQDREKEQGGGRDHDRYRRDSLTEAEGAERCDSGRSSKPHGSSRKSREEEHRLRSSRDPRHRKSLEHVGERREEVRRSRSSSQKSVEGAERRDRGRDRDLYRRDSKTEAEGAERRDGGRSFKPHGSSRKSREEEPGSRSSRDPRHRKSLREQVGEPKEEEQRSRSSSRKSVEEEQLSGSRDVHHSKQRQG